MSKNRPKQTDEYVLKIAMEKLFDKQIKNWLVNGGDTLEYVMEEKDRTIDELVEHYDDDAYRFARNLDNRGWAADTELVEALDCYFVVRNAYEEMAKQWVQLYHRDTAVYSVGMKATLQRSMHPLHKKEVVITGTIPKTLQYYVNEESTLKKDPLKDMNTGYIVNHEELIFAPGTIL